MRGQLGVQRRERKTSWKEGKGGLGKSEQSHSPKQERQRKRILGTEDSNRNWKIPKTENEERAFEREARQVHSSSSSLRSSASILCLLAGLFTFSQASIQSWYTSISSVNPAHQKERRDSSAQIQKPNPKSALSNCWRKKKASPFTHRESCTSNAPCI